MSKGSAIINRRLPSSSKGGKNDCGIVVFNDGDGNPCVNIPNPMTGEDFFKISEILGVKLGTATTPLEPDENGCITIPVGTDLYGTGSLSDDGLTLTVLLEGMDAPVDICITKVKGADLVDDAGNLIEELPVVNGQIQITEKNCVLSINGETPDDDGDVAIDQSTTTPSPDGLSHVIATSDGVETTVCLNPVKTINGIAADASGNVNPVDLFSNTVDNGDGTFTTTNSDGSTFTWAGDTFASQVDNGDGTATITFNDGSTVTVATGSPVTAVDNGDNTCTISIGGKFITVDNTPKSCVLTINGIAPDALGNINPADMFSNTVDNGDGTFTTTNADGSTLTWAGDTFASAANNGDGTATITFSDGSTLVVATPKDCINAVDNGDDTYTVTPSNGDPEYIIDTRCKKYIDMDIEPCPIAYPVCGVSAAGDTEFTGAASIQAFLDANYGDELVFNESDCTIKGCMLADVDFDLQFAPPASDIVMSAQGGDLGFEFITTSDGSGFTVTWPDGSTGSFGSDQAFSATNQPVGDVVVSLDNPCAKVTRIDTRLGSWDYNLESLFANVPSLTFYQNKGQNTTSGDLVAAFANVPGLTYYSNFGQNTTSGDLVAAFANVPGLTYYANKGQNTTSGDLVAAFANVPGLTFFQNEGQNTTSGDLVAAFANVPSLTLYSNFGQNTTSGDLVAAFANVPGLTFFQNSGLNTTSGDLVAAFANVPGLTYYRNFGLNTTSGDLVAAFANVPGLTYYANEGQNTTSGDLVAAFANVPGLTYYRNVGQNTAIVSGIISLNSTFRFFDQQGIGNTQAEVDFMLQSLANVTTWIVEKDIFLGGNNAAPSATGSAFIPTILANGADQVVTN